jgi:hypothetical protein
MERGIRFNPNPRFVAVADLARGLKAGVLKIGLDFDSVVSKRVERFILYVVAYLVSYWEL